LIGAAKAGIENWNAVFGFKVLEAVVGDGNESFADDDTNMLIWDPDPSLGYAFANWRVNPNTAEVRGASVYMNAGWVQYADEYFYEAAGRAPSRAARAPRPVAKIGALRWGGMKSEPLCAMLNPRHIEEIVAPPQTDGSLPPGGATALPMSKKQKVEQFIT